MGAPEIPSYDSTTQILSVNGTQLSLCEMRDLLLRLREEVYCPDCRCPNWLGNNKHFEGCQIGKLTEVLLKIAPKDSNVIRWKSG
jgi:hypothetical protein